MSNLPFNNEHICKLFKANILKPLHPGARYGQRLSRKLKTLVLLDLNDYRCKQFYPHPSLRRKELRRHVNSPYNYIIHPFSKISAYLQIIFFGLLIHRCIVDIIEHKSSPLLYSCYVCDILHFSIVQSFFFTGYLCNKTREVFTNQTNVCLHYLKTYFLVDVYLGLDQYYYLLDFAPLKIICKIFSKILYIVRFSSISYIIDGTLKSFGFGKVTVFTFSHLLATLLLLHIFTELIYWVPIQLYDYASYYPNSSWIARENLSFRFHDYSIETYIKSFLIVISYFLGAAYQDFVTEPNEQFFLAILTFTGRFYVLIIIAKVLTLFGHSNLSQSDYENRLYQLCNYMRNMKVPKQLQAKIVDRLKYNYQKKFFDEQELLSTFTDQIKIEIFLHGARKLINNNTILGYLPKHELTKLFVYMKSQIYDPEEIIQEYNSKHKYIFFILSGTVACYTKEGLEFLHLKDGDVFGLLSAYSNIDSTYYTTYVATEMTELYFVYYKYLHTAFTDRSEYLKYLTEIKNHRIKLIRQSRKFAKSGHKVISDLRRGALLEKPKLRYDID